MFMIGDIIMQIQDTECTEGTTTRGEREMSRGGDGVDYMD